MSKGLIGRLNWDACSICVHSDKDDGICDVPDSKWKENITVSPDYVYCGLFEREPE